MSKICIVTPGYISSTPRVVKEADALWHAGFDVKVVFSQGNLEYARQHDTTLLQGKPWAWSAVGWSPFRREEKWLYYWSKLRVHAARKLSPTLYAFGRIAEHGEGRIYKELAELAASEKAGLYIGHYPTGLAAAAHAASRWGAQLGYDVEDLHTAEQPSNTHPTKKTQRIRAIEGRYLLRCSHVTAVSDAIAEEMIKRYAISRPVVIHNVFPWAERSELDGQTRDRHGKRLSLYWYSQTIGEGRGIEDAIRAVGLLREKGQLHLRGNVSEDVRAKFLGLARESGVAGALHFHPPVPPTELLSRTAEHDVGLALEQPVNLSRMLSVTNKFFFYLLAGLAVAATDVPGQRRILSTCPDAGFLYPPGDYQTLASKLNRWLECPQDLQCAKASALEAAKTRWNWETESQRLVAHVKQLLGESTVE